MKSRPLHVVIWLPSVFYSAVAAVLAEIFELVNAVRHEEVFSFEYISRHPKAVSTAGISFAVQREPSRPMDALVLLAMPGLQVPELLAALARESQNARPLIETAYGSGAIVAAHCGASYFLADAGFLDRRRATISWWLKNDALRRFPKVRWDVSRLLIRHGRTFTCGGGFSGLELASALLKEMGYAKEERIVRKLLVLPPARQLQSPYEFPIEAMMPTPESFHDKLIKLSKGRLPELDVTYIARGLGMSKRTLARKVADELKTSPGRWIQDRRLEAAKDLLQGTKLTVSEICYRVGYQDVASFSRLFSRTTGLSPGEYRRQMT